LKTIKGGGIDMNITEMYNRDMTFKEKVIDIINWAEGKWGVGETTDNVIVDEIKKIIKEKDND
jgi:hypothetical protein